MIAQEAQYRDWMLAALAGDAAKYRMLLAALTRHLRSYFARRLSDSGGAAEDAVQETLIAIHARRATYDPSLPFTAWVYGIARYKLIDYLRRNRASQANLPIGDHNELAAADDQIAVESTHDIGQLLNRLPTKVRHAIESVKLEGRSVAETAVRYDMTESGVKVSIHRGIKALAKLIGRETRA